MFFTSLLMGGKNKNYVDDAFYLLFGLLIYIFPKSEINLKKLKYSYFNIFYFYFSFLHLFIFTFLLTQTNKRTDYPGKEISDLVQNRWDKNFSNEIELVSGDEWHGGNLILSFESRPKWLF